MNRKLSKLEKVPLREIWKKEGTHFTPWLAEKENLDLLGEELGINMQLIGIEESVGSFSLDILAEEVVTNNKIIIENQLESTNHDHLGKIITYASGNDAKVIIWVVKDARDEHKSAIEWLNEKSDEDIRFFLIRMEVWQIGNSDCAPKFEIIIAPNTWNKSIKRVWNKGELSELRRNQLDIWTKLKEYLRDTDKGFDISTPSASNWCTSGSRFGRCWLAFAVHDKNGYFKCELVIDNPDIDFFDYLEKRKDQVEKSVGHKLEWNKAVKTGKISIVLSVDDVFNKRKYPEYFEWFAEQAATFRTVFGKHYKNFKK
ncbi:MAG: DUF4268 domain-containing protein [Gammaproteobacteria bacterium]|nr:DUF4268 domain-containing protein [Gammaproteobacteria bacterium]